MVKDDILKRIAERAGIDISGDKFTEFKSAITSDTEVEVTMPEKWHTFSDETLSSRDKSKYEDGKTAGLEMTIKEFKTKEGLEFEGKSLDKLVEAVRTKAAKDAGKEPESRYLDLETKYKGKVTEIETLQSQLQQKENDLRMIGTKSSMLTALSEKGKETLIPADKIVTLFLTEHEFTDNGVKKKGASDVIKDDKTLQPIPQTDVFLSYAETFVKKDPMNPGGGSGGGGKDSIFKSFAEYERWKTTAKPDKETADKVLVNSITAAEDKKAFYD